MLQQFSFKVNGVLREVAVDADSMLIEVIRDVLNLTGTKYGCDNATCGACVVILNGQAVKSCNTPVSKAAGGDLVTVEGLAKGMELHPVQKALSESGAVQCGFCTPGIVMELVALFDQNPAAASHEIMAVLNKHLCRCTGYEPIQEGALLAQQLVQKRIAAK
jgi:aerobic carbon-monoxide dehydrogenase small subunit